MKKNLSIIITLIGVVLTGLIGYYQIIHKDIITLDIEKVNSTLLTRPLNIKGLKVSYIYHDSIRVKKLWETTFVIRNTGKTTILGDGFLGKNIKDDCLPIQITNCEQLLSATITNCNNASRLDKGKLYFTQWKQNEYVEIKLITEGKKSPSLIISDRDIIDSEITYSEYSPKVEMSNKKLIDSIPRGLANILKWFYSVVMGLSFLSSPFVLYYSMKEDSKKTNKNGDINIHTENQDDIGVLGKVIVGIFTILIFFLFFGSPILWMF